MAFDVHANLINVTVTVAPSPATSGTTLSISNADRTILVAALTAPFNMLVGPATARNETNCEIVRVSAIGAADSGGTGNAQLTIARQTESGGVNRSILVGDAVIHTMTKKALTDIEAKFPTGAVLGDTDTQTVTNKTLTDAANTVAQTFKQQFGNFVQTGLTIPTSGTLATTSVLGVIYYNGLYVAVASDGGHTYTASRDTYVDVSNAGVYTYAVVTNGAAAPALTANSIRIAKVVTSGSAVTSVTQDGSRDSLGNCIYPAKPIDFAQLIPTIFSSKITSFTNAGTGAGTFYYVNLGGIKLLWGSTGNISTTSGAGGAYTINLPSSFFTTVYAGIASVNNQTGVTQQYATINNGAFPLTSSPTTISGSVVNTSSGSGTASASVLLIGA